MLWRRQWQPTPVLLPGKSHGQRSLVGCSPWGGEESDTTEQLHFHSLEKEMATHSSVLAWRIPGMGEPGGLPSKGSHRVGHNWSDLAVAAAQLFLSIHGGQIPGLPRVTRSLVNNDIVQTALCIFRFSLHRFNQLLISRWCGCKTRRYGEPSVYISN